MTSRLVKELGAFGVVGGVCFVVDVGLFQLLYVHVGLGAVTAKLLATLASLSLAYLGHRFWSFAHRQPVRLGGGYLHFLAINGVTLALNLAVVAVVRYPLGQEGALALQAANLAAIAIGTVIRFWAYRRWVFRAPVQESVPRNELVVPR
jgi:putative flippase GtrA